MISQSNPSRTAANWMAKQPPLSPSRNREISRRVHTGGVSNGHDNLLNSQQSGSQYSRGDPRMRAIHSPENLKMVDSSSDFGGNNTNGNFNVSQPIGGRQGSSHKRPGNDMRAYKQY